MTKINEYLECKFNKVTQRSMWKWDLISRSSNQGDGEIYKDVIHRIGAS